MLLYHPQFQHILKNRKNIDAQNDIMVNAEKIHANGRDNISNVDSHGRETLVAEVDSRKIWCSLKMMFDHNMFLLKRF